MMLVRWFSLVFTRLYSRGSWLLLVSMIHTCSQYFGDVKLGVEPDDVFHIYLIMMAICMFLS